MKRIYAYLSYKKFLKDIIEAQGRGTVAKLAEAAGCNRTYITQCLSSKVQLTPDHIMGISDFLNLAEEEQDFFLLLLLYDRAATKNSQAKFKTKIDKLVQAELILSKKISQKSDSNELIESQKSQYYSSWKYAAIHTLVSIKEFQSLQAIAKKTRLTEQDTHFILKELNQMGLVQYQSGRWIHSGKNIHIPTGSIHNSQNHINWRVKSIEDANNKMSLHYTTLFSLSLKDWEELRETLLIFIEKQRDYIHKSGSEELYCFCCDLFQPLD